MKLHFIDVIILIGILSVLSLVIVIPHFFRIRVGIVNDGYRSLMALSHEIKGVAVSNNLAWHEYSGLFQTDNKEYERLHTISKELVFTRRLAARKVVEINENMVIRREDLREIIPFVKQFEDTISRMTPQDKIRFKEVVNHVAECHKILGE